jgi:O-antigen/teichoic acid export membrane protein
MEARSSARSNANILGMLTVLIGSTLYAASQWGVLIVLAQMGSPKMVGQFSLILAIATPVFLVTGMQLRAMHVTDALGRYGFGRLMSLRAIGNSIAVIVVMSIAVIWTERSMMTPLFIVAAAKAIEAFADLVHGDLQKQGRLSAIMVSQIAKSVFMILAVIVALSMGGGILEVTVAMMATWLLVAVILEWPRGYAAVRSGGGKTAGTHAESWSSILAVAAPLGCAAMAGSLSSAVPRYAVHVLLGDHALGHFSALLYLMTIGALIINAIGQVFSPQLGRLYDQGDRSLYWNKIRQFMVVGLTIGAIGVIVCFTCGPIILSTIYGKEYADHRNVLTLVALATSIGFTHVFLGTAATCMRIGVERILVQCAGIPVLVFGCWLLAPRYQLAGIAISMIAAELVVMMSFIALIMNREHGMRGNSVQSN